MGVGKRLFQYALTFKKSIIVALVLLSLAVSAELTGPFIAKKMIDSHILGIEQPWYETERNDKTVHFDGRYYIRADNVTDERLIKEVTIIQVNRAYYFIEDALPFDGERTVNENVVTIKSGEKKPIFKQKS